MSVEIKFEFEKKPEQTGVVAEGTYIWDAAKRMGVYLKAECDGRGTCDTCAVTIKHGAEHLSTPTSAEMQNLTDERRANGERLACQTRIQSSGEVTVMVKETEEEKEKPKEEPRDFRKEFEAMPLDKKFATLVEIESVALTDTVNFIASLPNRVTSKIVDLLGGFGRKLETQAKASRRPSEHQNETNGNGAEAKNSEEPAVESNADAHTTAEAKTDETSDGDNS